MPLQWQALQVPTILERAQKEGRAPNQIAYEIEVQQGKNIIDAAAKISTLDRLVLSTLSDTSKWSNGEMTHNYHFDAKARFPEYVQASYSELAMKTAYLQLAFFISNWRSQPFLAPSKQEDGSYVIPAFSYLDCKPLPWANETHDTGYFV
jgi:hypothetical protein